MPSVCFNTQEVANAYHAIILAKNEFLCTYTKDALQPIDDRIRYLEERCGELKRELASYSKQRSEWFYEDIFQEEKVASPLTLFKFNPVYIAKSLLYRDEETQNCKKIIKSHLLELDGIIETLSKTNMDLAERIRQKKAEMRSQPLKFSWRQEQDVEMKIRPPKQPAPHYLLPLNRTPRAYSHHKPISKATTVNTIPVGPPLTTPLTAHNSSTTFSSPSASPLPSLPATARNAAETLNSTVSFDKNALGAR